jgi:hypothetical protein
MVSLKTFCMSDLKIASWNVHGIFNRIEGFRYNTILQGVSKVPSSGSENLLIKLNKSFFGLERDVAIKFSYCVPQYSSYQLCEQQVGPIKAIDSNIQVVHLAVSRPFYSQLLLVLNCNLCHNIFTILCVFL